MSSTEVATTPFIASPAEAGAWRRWEAVAVGAVVLLAVALRLNGYAVAPGFTDNADEIQFTWAGLNLILHGDPYTWSYFSGYPSYDDFRAFGQNYPLVHHWMDHPPLFAYLMGAWVWLLGVRDMGSVTPEQVRAVPVALSSVSVLLAYLLGRRLLGPRAAFLGALLLATSPGAVLLGREVEPEALQAVMLLLALLFTLRLGESAANPAGEIGALLLLCVLAPLAKVSGIAVAGTCALVLAVRGRWRLSAGTAAAGAGGLLLFAAYGAIVDWGLFSHIITAQANNRIGVMSGYDFLAAMVGVNRRLRDGWWLLGWLGLATLMAARGRRRDLYLVWPAAAYAATMLVLAGERQVEQYGWYRWIIYPEVYLGAGWLAWWAVARPRLDRLALLLVLGGATATNWWLGGIGATWVPNPVMLAGLLLALLLPAGLAAWRTTPGARLWARRVAVLGLSVIVMGNVVESIYLADIFTRL